MIAELLQGAELVEYSAHNVPKGYKCILKKPYAAGFMAVGDSLGAFVKVGPLLDGMRRAITTGMMAARDVPAGEQDREIRRMPPSLPTSLVSPRSIATSAGQGTTAG